jgi:HEAT repeat protein
MKPFDASRLAPERAPEVLIREVCALSRESVTILVGAVHALTAHQVPQVRAEALGALFVTARIKEFRATAIRALSRDGDEYVRSKAALGIAATSDERTRRGDVTLLLRALRNEHETTQVRRSAYEALLLLFGEAELPDPLDDFDPKADVDWKWIQEIETLYGESL